MSTLSWFPQSWATEFFAIKGVLGMVATILFIMHMARSWSQRICLSQRMRYISLLAFSVMITGAPVEQIHDGALVNYRNLGAGLCIVWMVVTSLVSIFHDAHDAPCHSHHRPSF